MGEQWTYYVELAYVPLLRKTLDEANFLAVEVVVILFGGCSLQDFSQERPPGHIGQSVTGSAPTLVTPSAETVAMQGLALRCLLLAFGCVFEPVRSRVSFSFRALEQIKNKGTEAWAATAGIELVKNFIKRTWWPLFRWKTLLGWNATTKKNNFLGKLTFFLASFQER